MRLPRPIFGNATPERLSKDEVTSFALRSGWIDDRGVINSASTTIERLALDWWPNHDLLMAVDPMWDPVCAAWVLERAGRLVRLDGTSPPIHELNKKIGPEITRENALAYLTFFCTFVHGDEGPFSIVGSIDDEFFPAEVDREKVETHFREPKILKEEKNAEGDITFHIECLVVYSDALFISNFRILPSGMVDMLEDELLEQEIGAHVKLPLKLLDKRSWEEETETEDTGGLPN